MLIQVVTPCFNDWESFIQLNQELNALAHDGLTVRALVVDDGSTEPPPAGLKQELESNQGRFLTVPLNVGHQRAIAIGLSYVADNLIADLVVVIDSDGEDRPENIRALIRKCAEHPNKIAVAKRMERAESTQFKIFYFTYKFCFRLLTGQVLDFGNFQIIPFHFLDRITRSDALWNHFPATVMRSKLDIVKVPTNRSARYFGSSKMNFVSLVNHGFNAITVFLDVVFIRLLVFLSIALVAISLLGTFLGVTSLVTQIHLLSNPLVIWIVAIALLVLIQVLITVLATGLLPLSDRSRVPLVPRNIYTDFIANRPVQ